MQKKKNNFLNGRKENSAHNTVNFFEKIVKKDYNNELEEVLEKKYFDENVKSILLNILYKIETAYKDYERVKVDVTNKEKFIQNIIDAINNNCDEIKLVNLNSQESKILGKKTFLVEKNKKRIICYPIERKLLYSISKISKNEKIIKDKYPIINKTLSDLINVGNSIDTVEPMRDFNGYSWTNIPKEIESIYHNIIYQNIRILVGNEFINRWIENSKSIIDYFEEMQNNLEAKYGKDIQKEMTENLCKISVLLAYKYNPKLKSKLAKERTETKQMLDKMKDNKEFIQDLTKEKRELTKEVKQLDETINNKTDLQKEYEKRNRYLPLEEKIFSVKILSKLMVEEREKKIKKIEELNKILNPQNFVKYKKVLQNKIKYLELTEIENIKEEIIKSIINIQKIFLDCYKIKIEKAMTKQEIINLIYEFRYYCLLPMTEEKLIFEEKTILPQIEEIQKKLIKKAHTVKVIGEFTTNDDINYEILKNIFYLKVINLEGLYIKITKEKEKNYIQIFDENAFEEKIELKISENIEKKYKLLKYNKKIKIFN